MSRRLSGAPPSPLDAAAVAPSTGGAADQRPHRVRKARRFDSATTSALSTDTAGADQQQQQQQQPQQPQQQQHKQKQQRHPSPVPQQQEPPAQLAAAGSMSDFEAARAARIAANAQRLAALQLPELAAGLAAAATSAAKKRAPTQRGAGAAVKRARAEPPPRRHSARVRGQAAEYAAGILSETRDGGIVLAAAPLSRQPAEGGAGGAAAGGAAAPPPPPPGPMPFASISGDAASDAAFLEVLRRQSPASGGSGDVSAAAAGAAAAARAGGGRATGSQLMATRLVQADVAKLTSSGVVQLAFHPSAERLLLAAADKGGKVGLWDVDYGRQQQQQQAGSGGGHDDGGDAGGAFDGTLLAQPHRDYVSSLKWLGGGAALLTAAYDGLVRRLDVGSGVWELVLDASATAAPTADRGPRSAGADDGWSAGEADAEAGVAYLATPAGQLQLLDLRTGRHTGAPLEIAHRKVNTLSLADTLLASSSSDGAVAVWDVRRIEGGGGNSSSSSSSGGKARSAGRPLAAFAHSKSCQAAYFAPGGSAGSSSGRRLATISFDDTVRVWDVDAAAAGGGGGSAAAPITTASVTIKHDNATGRWLLPLRPAWSPAGDAVLCGDLRARSVSAWAVGGKGGSSGVGGKGSSGGGAVKLGAVANAELMTAVASRLATHPAGLPVLAAATASGRVHVWR